jgi:DNA-binding MarR family transcriptional regulator
MGDKDPTKEHSKSICEAALEHYSALDDTLAEMIRAASIEVRDFMLLSFVCDQGSMSIAQISRALGFSDESTQRCVDRLILAQLVHYKRIATGLEDNHEIIPTTAGKRVTRRIHNSNPD